MSATDKSCAPTPSLSAQAFCLLVAKTLGFALTIALPLLLVRTLRQADFGVYKQAFLIVGTATTVLPLGFGMSAYYFLPRHRDSQRSVVFHVLLIHTAVGALAAAALTLWPGLLARLFDSTALTPYAPVLAAVIFTWTVGSFLEIVPVAYQDVKASTFFIIGSQASKTFFFVVAAVGIGTVQALIYAALAQGVLQVFVLWVYLARTFPGFWTAFDWPMLRTQAGYALPLGLSGLVLKLQNDLPHYFVAHAFGASTYAIFAVGVFNLPLTSLLRESVGSVMLPRVSRLEQEQNPRVIVELVSRVARKLALVYFPMYVCLMILGREFISVLFTPRYLTSWPVFSVYLTLIPLGALVLDPITRAFAEQRFFVLKLRLALFTIMAITLWLATDRLGLVGTIWLMVLVQIAGTALAALKLARVMHLGIADLALFSPLARIGAASVAAGGVCAAARAAVAAGPLVTLMLCGTVYVVAYLAAIAALRVLLADEVSLLRRWLPSPRIPSGTFVAES